MQLRDLFFRIKIINFFLTSKISERGGKIKKLTDLLFGVEVVDMVLFFILFFVI